MLKNPYILAEAGINHDGSLKKAKLLIKQAKLAGADGIKFQTFQPKSLFSQKYYAKALNLPADWIRNLKNCHNMEWNTALFEQSQSHGIDLVFTPFSPQEVHQIEKFKMPFIKIASCDLTNFVLLEAVSQRNIPLVLSTGLASKQDITNTLKFLKNHNCEKIILLHCIVEYPTPSEHMNLKRIRQLSLDFGCPVGLSDHTTSIHTPAISISHGACFIEKHFTFNNNLKHGDHPMSLNKTQFNKMKTEVDLAFQLQGTGQYFLTDKEKKELTFARRSLYYKYTLKKDHKLSINDIEALRPNSFVSADQMIIYIGKKLNTDVKQGEPLRENHFD